MIYNTDQIDTIPIYTNSNFPKTLRYTFLKYRIETIHPCKAEYFMTKYNIVGQELIVDISSKGYLSTRKKKSPNYSFEVLLTQLTEY